jgi:hypothetical protein
MRAIGDRSGGRLVRSVRPAVLVAVGIALSAFFTPGGAQETGGDGWHFGFTPTVWMAGLDGSLTINGKPSTGLGIKQSFGDLLKILDMAAMGTLEARKGRWGAAFDALYFKLADEGTVTGPFGFVSITATSDITEQIYSLAATYRVKEGSSPADVVAGARYTSIQTDMTIFASDPDVGAGGKSFSEKKSWTDPYVGIRIQQEVTPRFSLMGYADVGGFGAGSELALQGVVGANYAFNRTLHGKLGYRYMSVDYRETDFTYDMANAGLYVGLGIHW